MFGGQTPWAAAKNLDINCNKSNCTDNVVCKRQDVNKNWKYNCSLVPSWAVGIVLWDKRSGTNRETETQTDWNTDRLKHRQTEKQRDWNTNRLTHQ